MQSDKFVVKSPELNLELSCKLLKLPKALFVWVGIDDTLGKITNKDFVS